MGGPHGSEAEGGASSRGAAAGALDIGGVQVRNRIHVVVMVLVAFVAADLAGGQGKAGRPSRAPSAGDAAAPSPLATVGSLRVGRDELDQQVRQALQVYRDRNKTELDPQLEPLVRRQVLENLIRQRLLALDARRRGVTVSDAEAEAQVRRDSIFQQGGLFNEAKYLALKAANPDAYAQALAAAKEFLAVRKVSEQMERETRPDEATIRTQLERELTRTSVEYVALRRADFDGGFREPREEELLAFYAANAGRYRCPEQASLSVIMFNRPAASDTAGATAAGYRAWEQRMRARADSALAAIRAGATFDALARANGGMAVDVVLRRDRLPDFWRGGPRDVAAVFAAAPGTVLPEPVRAAPGWALVRVEAITRSRIAPLREVAREIRSELRAAAKARSDDRLLGEIYAARRDSLRGDGYRARYALADTASFPSGQPTARDLDRFYRAHLADYSSYDRASGTVVETPIARVREDLRWRWLRERRRELTREAAERLRDTWGRGRRDAALERAMTFVREIGPVPAGAAADTGQVGAALGEALAARGGRTGVTMVPTGAGYLVCDLQEVVRDYLPTFEQARLLLAPRLEARRAAEEAAAARATFERDPSAFRAPATLRYSHVLIEPPSLLNVELTRDEIERFYRAHVNEYSIEELVRVRHILVSPTEPGAVADAAARAKAEALLARVRSGEDFARLAAESSDDPATRDQGGDVGVFRHGQMREEFERAAFAMRLGDIAGPVRTEVGYHILECLEYVPPVLHPIAEVYANVAYDCARKKADRIAADRADSLYRTLRSVAQAKAVAARHRLEVIPTEHAIGAFGGYDDAMQSYIRKLETLRPGEFYPGTQYYEGLGQVITWVDSVVPPRLLRWDEAKGEVVERDRRDNAQRALLAKKAELDSMLSAGWSLDSLAAPWGGLERLTEAPRGSQLRDMGGKAVLDSLVFGRERAPLLQPGQVSAWLEFPGGYAKLRVVGRLAPDPEVLARRLELRRQLVLWRRLNEYFDRLKARYPVQILDGELRATALPEPTES